MCKVIYREAEIQQFHTKNFIHTHTLELVITRNETLIFHSRVYKRTAASTLNLITTHHGDIGQNEDTVILFQCTNVVDTWPRRVSYRVVLVHHTTQIVPQMLSDDADRHAAAGLARDPDDYNPASSEVQAEDTMDTSCWLSLLSEQSGCSLRLRTRRMQSRQA